MKKKKWEVHVEKLRRRFKKEHPRKAAKLERELKEWSRKYVKTLLSSIETEVKP